MNNEFAFIIAAEKKGSRLDQFLVAEEQLRLSRSQIKNLIDQNWVLVNGERVKAGYKLRIADRIMVKVPPPREGEIKAEAIPLSVVYEDEDLIVVDKPKGMVVHPAPGNYTGTLVNALLNHTNKLASLGAPLRPGIVHRLDKDTSGLLVVAKSDAAYYSLVKQLKDRTVEKTYLALVHGVIKNDQGVIEARLGRHPVHRKKMAVIEAQSSKPCLSAGRLKVQRSREAITEYKVIERFIKYSLLEVKIKTGRTHQIRVHMSYIGHPVVGDQTYGKKKEEFTISGQLLHAFKLSFIHPRSGKVVAFEAKMPGEMETIIKKARSG